MRPTTSGIGAAQLLTALHGDPGRRRQSPAPELKFATIASDYVSGRPKVIFDGETTAGDRTYPYLDGYTPAASDRVLVALVNRSGVILGRIT